LKVRRRVRLAAIDWATLVGRWKIFEKIAARISGQTTFAVAFVWVRNGLVAVAPDAWRPREQGKTRITGGFWKSIG